MKKSPAKAKMHVKQAAPANLTPTGENTDTEIQQALILTEARLKALFEYMQNGVVILRPEQNGSDFIIVDMNRAAERIEKIKRDKAIGKSVLKVLPGLEEFGLLDVFRSVLRTGKPIDHPVTRYKDDRLEGWRDHFVYRLPSGELVTVYSDETRRKQAEEEMHKSHALFRAVVESVPDCIFIQDASLRFTYVNPAVEKLLGRPASEILGQTAEDIYGEEAGRTIRQWDRRVLQGQSLEEEHTRPVDGVYLTFHDIRVPLKNHTNEVVGVCGIARNITERKRLSWDTQAGGEDYRSDAMREVVNKAFFASTTDSIILLQGESGSGKDYLARWIHDHSRRVDGPFFALNCAAISPELAESELFGHEHGAFTGARGKKKGLLELAEGGTLLLNEIGELSLAMQSKLLTFLDTRSYMRVGGNKSIRVDARLIAATHRNLESEVQAGRFLPALFYRLNVFPIVVPPLRQRVEDIPIIAQTLLKKLTVEMQFPGIREISPEDLEALARYHWPGNIRELRNVLERSLMLSQDGDFRVALSTGEDGHGSEWVMRIGFPSDGTLKKMNDLVTESLCREALRRCKGNRKAAARLLGISRDSMHRHIRRFRLVSDNRNNT
jgi:PAS domain S-box-containing protein